MNKLENALDDGTGFELIQGGENCELKQVVYAMGTTKPEGVKRFYNQVTQYYVDWCVERIMSRFKFNGFPDGWDKDYVKLTLLIYGHVAIFNDAKYGVVCASNSFQGQNIYYRPTDAVIANPILGSKTLKIDDECVVVKLKSNYRGYAELVAKYAYQLAQCDSSIDVNLWNSKVTSIYRAKDNKEAKEMKLINQKVSEGQPAVYTSSDVLNADSVIYLPAKQNYVADLIQDTKRTLICEFLSEIGINNSPIDKKERVNVAEVNSNNEDVENLVMGYVDRMNEEFDKANEMFGMNLSVDLSGKEVVNNVQSSSISGVGPRPV